jgi:tight adherence protein C
MTMLIGILLLALCGTAIAAAASGYAQPRTRALARVREIEAYGFDGDATAAGRAQVEPRTSLFVLIGARVGKLLDRGWIHHYERWMRSRLISAAIYDFAARTVVGLQFVAAAVVGILVALTAPGSSLAMNVLLTVSAAAIFWSAPLVYVHGRAARRLDLIERQVPDLIDMLVVILEAGLGFGASMEVSSTRMRAPIGDEVRLTMQEQSMGLGMPEALTNTLARVDTPNMSAFVRSVVQGNALGISMGLVMRNLAVDMRVRRRQQAEERAHKAPVKMLFPLIFLMFPALGVVILGPAMFEITEKLGGTVGG